MEIIKKTKNNGVLLLKEITYDVAKKMMLENHYSKKWNTSFGKINIGIFKDGELLGGAVFGNLMNPNSYVKITEEGRESVIELNRMWIDDKLGKNAETVLISQSFKILKKSYPHVKFVQSFADGRLGCGTIYKASNFKYFGYDESLFFEDIETGEVFHKVPLENTKRPQGFLNKNRRYLDKKLKPFYVKTYRYIYPLYKYNDLKLKEKSYPEYNKGMLYTKMNHSIGLLCRLGIMYKEIGDTEYYQKAMNHMINDLNFSKEEIIIEIENQKKNNSYIWFVNEYITNKKNVDKILKSE